MKRRDFVKLGTLAAVGTALTPMIACDTTQSNEEEENTTVENTVTFIPFELPTLAYGYDALNPVIDTETMTIHHTKHHQGYVNKVNATLEEGHAWAGKTLPEMFAMLEDNEENISIRNNGGGHYNHRLFWQCLRPLNDVAIPQNLAEAINNDFGSFENFAEEFSTAAATQFGSGWAWLSIDSEGKLFVSSTPNQDNPLMKNIVEKSGTPILGIDVWEHAYYLNYQNKRKEYIKNFISIIDWDFVAKRYTEKLG